MAIVLFIVGVIAAIIGGILIRNGWNADPREWGMIVGGAALAIVGIALAGGAAAEGLSE